MAGARIGYLAAAPEVVEKLLLVRLPYHLSAVTQAVARAALALAAEPLATVTVLRADEMGSWLAQAAGPAVADSDANFVLFGRFDSTGARSGRDCSTAACSCVRSARRAGCGSR